jgi:hypothetical protein
MQQLTFSAAWGLLMAVAELGVCALAWARRLQQRLPFFTTYLVLLVVVDCARWWVVMQAGANSRTYSWVFWLTQPVLLAGRAAALGDVCRAALKPYAGVWQLTRLLLAGAAVALLVVAAARTAGARGMASYFIFAERELEVAIVVTVVLLLVVSGYYGVALERPLRGIAFGLVFYSSVVIINSSILMGPLALSWPVWSAVRIGAFDVALVAWFLALRLPLPEPVRPQLTSAAQFEQASIAVDQRMREVNARLLQLLRR